MKRNSEVRKDGVCIASSNKAITLLVITVCISSLALGQTGSGSGGITAATNEVKGYFNVGTNLMYAVGAIVGLVGATKVYNKWNSGDQDTAKTASAWFGSCIFLVVVATVLKGFFGV